MNLFARLFRRSRLDDELAEELRQHLDEKVDEFIERGLDRDEAIAAAHREFGNVPAIQERARDAWGFRWLADLSADVRYGVRQLVRQRGLTAVCVATLALAIGANGAVFSAVYAVVLRPLPFSDAKRLVVVTETRPGNVTKTGSPFTRYAARAARNTVFEMVGGYWDVSGGNGLVFGGDSPRRLQFSIVTSSFFPLLGVQPTIGRAFLPSEDAPSPSKVFVASHALWQGTLGGDRGAIGKTFDLDGEAYTLVGVMPRDFRFPAGCDVWMPVGTLPARMLDDRVSHQFRMVARLRAAVDVTSAQMDLDRIQAELAREYPATDGDWQARVTPLVDDIVGSVRASLWTLFAAVGLVLLVACANIVNLLLARAVTRQREFAIRGALGASATRLARQVIAESLLIALAAIPLALLLADAGLQLIVTIGTHSLPRLEQIQLDVPVLVFCAGLTIVATLFVGVVPAMHASNLASSAALGDRSGSSAGTAARQRNGLVVAEVALTFVLLAAAGALLRGFAQLTKTDPGFVPSGVVTMKIALPDARYPRPEDRAALLGTLLDRLATSPGVKAVAATDRLPLSGENNWGAINIAGRPRLDSAHAPVVQGRSVSADYFRTLGIPLRRGRLFTDGDVRAGRRVVVINEAMANQFWHDADPLGQRILSAVRADDTGAEIIGVVANVKEEGLASSSPPEMYAPYRWWSVMNVVIRSPLDAAALAGTVRAEVLAIDRNVPVYDITDMEAVIRQSTAAEWFELWLLGVFASIALTLAAIGIYGVLAFNVNRRTRDIGVRLALGATRRQLMNGVLAEGMQQLAVGLAVGLVFAAALVRADPVALVGTCVLTTAVGLAACVLPARRAMRVDPMVAMRCD